MLASLRQYTFELRQEDENLRQLLDDSLGLPRLAVSASSD